MIQTFEEGVTRLNETLDALDEMHAYALLPGLRSLLSDGLKAAHPAIGTLAEELVQALTDYGAAGAWMVTASGYPAPDKLRPSEMAISDALTLRLASPKFARLAAVLIYHGEMSAEDYPREVVVSALLEAASPARDREMDVLLDRVEEARPRIRALPSRRAVRSHTYYEVTAGDTIQDVAYAVLGSREAWPDLVRMYRLVPPYILEHDQRDGVLFPGERLELPRDQEAQLRLGAGLGDTFEMRPEDPQRVDLKLTDYGDLRVSGGMEGFASDMALRAMTPMGDLLDEPDYGVPRVAGLPATEGGLAYALMLNEALYADDRVGKITSRAKAGTSAPRGVIVDEVEVLPRPDLVEG